MKFSMKSDYALRALLTLADCQEASPISIRDIAYQNDVPKRFLEQIMLEMKEKGWVNSTLGRDGGYFLSKQPEEITMGEVVRHFDGVLAPIGCVSVTSYQHCSQEATCRFRRIQLVIRNYISSLMDNTTLNTLLSSKPVSESELLSSKNSNHLPSSNHNK